MTASAQPEIRFRIDGEDRAKAEQVASRIGMSINDAMKIMLKRFILEGGLPFDMRQPAVTHGTPAGGLPPIHGVTHTVFAEIAAHAARDAHQSHIDAGRMPPLSPMPKNVRKSRRAD